MSSSVHRPCVSRDFASQLAKKFFNVERISEIKELSSYSDRNFYVRGRRNELCKIQETAEQREYVLKILNSTDSEHGEFVDAENEAMTFLRERGFPCPLLFPVKGSSEMKMLVQIPLYNNDSFGEALSFMKEDANSRNEWCVIRLISFLPGVTAESFGKFNCENLFIIGQFVGKLSQTLQVRTVYQLCCIIVQCCITDCFVNLPVPYIFLPY